MARSPRPLRVLHLTGSAVDEFFGDLSRLYAADALVALDDPDRYEHLVAVVFPDGAWSFPDDLGEDAVARAPRMGLADALAHLAALHLDVMVPQMFCLPGMTSYRSLFDVLRIPYVGNPADVMAVGAHKARARAIVAAAGVRVPRGEVLRRGEPVTLPLPVVVKPVDADNSSGVSLVTEASALPEALSLALAHSPQAVVEDYVELGREVRCGLVERGGELVGLPLEEYAVDPHRKPIRDAKDKLRRGDEGALHLVAKDADHAWVVDVDDPLTERVWQVARLAHRALGCRDYSLFDFRVDPQGQPWFLEASLYCSFARTSVLAVMAQAAGTDVTDLFAELVEVARSRAGTTTPGPP